MPAASPAPAGAPPASRTLARSSTAERLGKSESARGVGETGDFGGASAPPSLTRERSASVPDAGAPSKTKSKTASTSASASTSTSPSGSKGSGSVLGLSPGAPPAASSSDEGRPAFLLQQGSTLGLVYSRKWLVTVRRDGEVLLRGSNGSSKSITVADARAVSSSERRVVIGADKFVARTRREAQQLVDAIRASLTSGDGYVTCEEDELEDDHAFDEEDRAPEDASQKNDAEAQRRARAAFVSTPASLPTTYWTDPGTSGLRIRGPDYLTTKRKMPAQAKPLFDLVALDLVSTPEKLEHIAAHPMNRIALARARGDADRLPFTFVLNFQVPGPPFYHFVMYYQASDPRVVDLLRTGDHVGEQARAEDAEARRSPPSPSGGSGSRGSLHADEGDVTHDEFGPGFRKLLVDFFLGEDDRIRDACFKFIPKVADGPLMLRSLCPSNKPVLLGNKLKIRYFRTPGVIEFDIDTSVDKLVDTLTKTAVKAAKAVVVDLFFCVESKNADELPEFVVGQTRARNIDFAHVEQWPMPAALGATPPLTPASSNSARTL